MKHEHLEDYVTSIPDFPEPGIIFRDITTILQDPDGFKMAVDGLIQLTDGLSYDGVVALEARGFIFGTPVAYADGTGFIPIRKKGKLPRKTISEKYALEYGEAEIEIHEDATKKGGKYVIIDDLLATGGTVEAACHLVEKLGGEVVRICFVMELAGLKGREKLSRYDVRSLITYEGK